MVKLITLKDIAEEFHGGHLLNDDTYELGRLKREAIKEIKQIQYAMEHDGKNMPDFLCPYNHIDNWLGHCGSIIVYIKWKFNITEEDLKQ